MPKMPEKSPEVWAAFFAWLEAVAPTMYAPALAAFIAILRVVYGGGTRRQMILEGGLCGGMTLALKPALLWAGLPVDMAIFLGACAGFVGVEKLRDWFIRWGEKKASA
jgi:lambda family phage holin